MATPSLGEAGSGGTCSSFTMHLKLELKKSTTMIVYKKSKLTKLAFCFYKTNETRERA